jgi:alkylation response protein AidB-like acyl-CoA dehydrogenase
VLVPEVSGGLGRSAVEVFLLGRAHGAALLVTPFLGTSILGGSVLSALDPREDVGAMLHELAMGTRKIALAHFERSISQKAGDLTTHAVRQGSGYELSGEKVCVLGGNDAGSYIVSARVHDEQGGHRLSLFHVAADAHGLQRIQRRLIDGQPAAWLKFYKTHLASEQLLISGPQAQVTLDRALNMGIVESIGEAAGAAQAAFEIASDYIRQRKQFGRALSTFQVLRHRVADMWMIVQELTSLGLAAAKAVADDDNEAATLLHSAKVHAGTAGLWVVEQAVQMHGAMGITNEGLVGQYLKRAVVVDRLFGDADHHLAALADANSNSPRVR